MSISPLPMPVVRGRIDIAAIRREQIVEAAIDIIAHHGLHHLSLSKIEHATGMKRGQLTYYFHQKEDILLAVFDRLLLLMYQRMEAQDGPREEMERTHSSWEMVHKLLLMVLGPPRPGDLGPEFHALQHTFLAQMAHREDFRQRLAFLYEDWRSHAAEHWKRTARHVTPLARSVSPRTLASFMQAIIHGLFMQMAADPDAIDRKEMLKLCIGVLAPLFGGDAPRRKAKENDRE